MNRSTTNNQVVQQKQADSGQKPTNIQRRTVIGGALLAGALAAVALLVPLAAQERRSGHLRIVKDCSTYSGIPGSTFCEITVSNVPELPAGTKIYYNQITAGPSAGPGYLDSNVFAFVNTSQWAVGRCTVPFDNTPGLCTLTDGFGPLAGFTARINVTHSGGPLYAWDGRYHFNPDEQR